MRVLRRLAANGISAVYAKRKIEDNHCETLSDLYGSFASRNMAHAYMHAFFSQRCHPEVKAHRRYFKSGARGFGEDAFHAMWEHIFLEYKPVHCLEIGVYRGQVISLWALLGRIFGYEPKVLGISPFSDSGDEVSRYSDAVDYYSDTLGNYARFSDISPTLVKAYSMDSTAVEAICSRSWDLIYIDGSHDFDTVREDYMLCRSQLAPGGILVLDDSSLYTDFEPPLFSFAGHPGPSRVMSEIALSELRLVCAVGHNNVFVNEPVS